MLIPLLLTGPVGPVALVSGVTSLGGFGSRSAVLVSLLLGLAATSCERSKGRPRAVDSEPAISPQLGAVPSILPGSGRDANSGGNPSASPAGEVRPEVRRTDSGDQYAAASGLRDLSVPGFGDAVIFVPAEKNPRVMVVALHGNFDRPEWQCREWARLGRRRFLVLCPRGVARDDTPENDKRWTYRGYHNTRAEIAAAMASIQRESKPARLVERVLVSGFSLGAIHLKRIVWDDPTAYTHVLFVEGGHEGWGERRARRHARAGGARLLFVCGQTVCRNGATQAVSLVGLFGGRAAVRFDGSVGHRYSGPVADLISDAVPWFLSEPGAKSMQVLDIKN